MPGSLSLSNICKDNGSRTDKSSKNDRLVNRPRVVLFLKLRIFDRVQAK